MKPPKTFELIIGPSGNYYYFKPQIVERIRRRGNFEYDFVYFLPVKRAVRYFKEQLVDVSENRVLADPPVYTFYQFMVEFYRTFPRARKVISPAMRLFLVEEALKKNLKKFRFFSESSAKRRGLVKKVDTLLTELREYGYTSELLLNQSEEEDLRAHDFALCIDTFETLLGDKLIDEAGAIQKVIEHLDEDREYWRKRFPEVDTIYMSGYGLFSRPMIRFFEVMRNAAAIKIKLDYLPEYPQLFSHVDPAFEMLSALKPTILQDKRPAPWENQLFRRHTAGHKLFDLGKKVLIQPSNHRNDEVAFIANYAKRLHLEAGIPLHKIGLTFPSLEDYAPLIHEIFPRYGLPYNLSTGFQLSQSPLVRSLLLVLEAPLLRCEVKKLVQVFSSPFFLHDSDKHPDISVIKSIAHDLRLNHFQGQWVEELEKHISWLQNQVDEMAGDDDFERAQLQKKIEQYEQVLPLLREILDKFAILENRQVVGEFRDQYLTLLEDFGFLDWYENENNELSPPEREREFRAFNRFSKLLDQFSWIISKLHPGQKLGLKEFHQYLSLLVSQATYSLREWADFGVQIMPRLEVMASEPEVVIFGGMIEGSFPRPFTQDVFFHDDQREKLGLSATEDLLAQDRYLFYQILSASYQRLVFTYPRFQKEAARVPSNFLNILSDQLIVNWRNQVVSDQFLLHRQALLSQVAKKIPAGADEASSRSLSKWMYLSADDINGQEMAQRWLQRVRSNYRKRRVQAFSAYEGILTQFPGIVDYLNEKFCDSAFSITRLETFAFCPIRFFFRYLLGVEEEQEIEPGLTPLERGQVVHNTLFRFYQTLKKENRQHAPWEAAPLLKKIAEEEFDRLPFSGMLFELEKERYFGTEFQPGLWDVFLRQEENHILDAKFYPAFFEVAFGRAGRKSEQDPISSSEPILLERKGEQIRLIGKVDRIDLNKNGDAMLLDYKTGSAASHAKDVLDGLSLQLPVYAAVLSNLLARGGQQAVPAMTAIYQVKDAENCDRIPEIFDKEAGIFTGRRGSPAALPNSRILSESGEQITFHEMLNRVEGYIFDYVKNIRRGAFRHTRFPDKPACESYCEFRRICRKDVRKLLENRG